MHRAISRSLAYSHRTLSGERLLAGGHAGVLREVTGTDDGAFPVYTTMKVDNVGIYDAYFAEPTIRYIYENRL